MGNLGNTDAIRLFEFYLAAMFVLGLMRRCVLYWDTLVLLVAVRGRWPKLVERLAEHRAAVLNWATILPAALLLLLMGVQLIASRLIWPQAKLHLNELPYPWWQLVLAVVTLLPMLAVDFYFLYSVGSFDRREAEKYFDQAEFWAGTWKSKAVRVLTLGKIDPDKTVNEEVKKGMVSLSKMASWALWWSSVQMILRLLFGLTIWTLWALR